ncbi:hypothetical protein V1525DRAFT_335157 [Lipomyces kononenkoae]|uniref:Uncharacterized protein n=1 Tax=Lipomyces kononenkoae TaxID=34357 RepID=A0ACC3TB21_LIPKO
MSSSSSNVLPEDQDELSQTNVSNFLKRLDDLKQATGSDEKDRARRLEEEIAEARRQRLARRQARSGSVSPEKFVVHPSTQTRPAHPAPKSGVTVQKELTTAQKSTHLSYETCPSLSPTTAVAHRTVDVLPQTSPSPKKSYASSPSQATSRLQGTHGIPPPSLGQDSRSVKITPSSPTLKVSAPLALKSAQGVSTMEKIKMWEKSAENVPAPEKIGEEPTVVPVAADMESRGKKVIERSDVSLSPVDTSAELSTRESESSCSSLATEPLAQSESGIINSRPAQLHARSTVREEARKENDVESTLSLRSSSSTVASTLCADANVSKEKHISDREEERLSKFLRPVSQTSPPKDRLRSNDAPYLPSPSMVSVFCTPLVLLCF